MKLENTSRKSWKVKENSRICRIHFEEDCFLAMARRADGKPYTKLRLKPNAVPSLFTHNEFKMKEGRKPPVFRQPPELPEVTSKVTSKPAVNYDHDHSYMSSMKPEMSQSGNFLKKDLPDTTTAANPDKSRMTEYGVESDFIPDLAANDHDSDLVTFLKQKIVFQQEVIQSYRKEIERAETVLNTFLTSDQIRKLGFKIVS